MTTPTTEATPGMWQIGANTSRGLIIFTSEAVPGRDDHAIGYAIDCPGGRFPAGEEAAANARLFAASKELLAVAMEAARIHTCSCSEQERDDGNPCLKCQAESAINLSLPRSERRSAWRQS